MAAPFLTYLTVFKSRLGLANLVLELSGFVHQPDAALSRKVRSVLEQTKRFSLSDPTSEPVLKYLTDKRLISREARARGRYSGFILELGGNGWRGYDRRGNVISELPVFVCDVWLAHPDIPSTIGVPTPDNVGETVELAFQLRLLSRAKNTWTAAGQLSQSLRKHSAELLPDPGNPFLLGVEALSLMRQVVAADGLLLRELVRELAQHGGEQRISRDDIATSFPAIVERAVSVAKDLNTPAPSLREALDFLSLIRDTAKKRNKLSGTGGTTSRAPGVLEHRVSPRLEWLTDLGYLTKRGLAKNAFEYKTTEALPGFLDDLDSWAGRDDWPEEVTIAQWARNPMWRDLRSHVASQSQEVSFRQAYELMRRRIGPAPLREVAFAAAVMQEEHRSFERTVAELIAFAQATDGAALSGGRYRRSPENIFLADTGLSK